MPADSGLGTRRQHRLAKVGSTTTAAWAAQRARRGAGWQVDDIVLGDGSRLRQWLPR